MTESERKQVDTIKALRAEIRALKAQAAEKDAELKQLRKKLADLMEAIDGWAGW